MATYSVDITQALTPSAPDVSGAVRAIQSQAGIAQTLFGGISSMIEQDVKSGLKKVEEEGEALQKAAFEKDELQKKAESDLIAAEQKYSSFLQTPPTTENEELLQKFELPFKSEITTAAKRLKDIQEAGGYGTRQNRYLAEVKQLVETWRAKYPGYTPEIRKVVEQATGVPGADLWAQQQFVKRMFTPPQAVDTNKAAEKAKQDTLDYVAKYTNLPPEDLLAMRDSGDPQWDLHKNAAMAEAAADAAIAANKRRQEALGAAVAQDVPTIKGGLISSANLLANREVNKTIEKIGPQIKRLAGVLGTGQPSDSDITEANIVVSTIKTSAEQVYNQSRFDLGESLRKANASTEQITNAYREFDENKKSYLDVLETSTPAQISTLFGQILKNKDASLDRVLKVVQGHNLLTGMGLTSDSIKQALPVDEFNEKGEMNPEWKNLEQVAPRSLQFVRDQQRAMREASIVLGKQLIQSGPIAITFKDATSSPTATPALSPDEPRDSQVGRQELVALSAVDIARTATLKAAETADKLSMGTKMPVREVVALREAWRANAEDIMMCSTALCNAAKGNALQIIVKDENAFKDFFAKIPEAEKGFVKAAVSQEVQASLEAARKGLVDINKKYKTNLSFGVAEQNETFGIVPPPAKYFNVKGDPDLFTQFATAVVTGYTANPSPVPKPFSSYFPPGTSVKPEYVAEVNKLATAAQEWNNTYLPRVVGSFSGQSVLTGEKKFEIAKNFMRSVDSGKPITGFFTIPVPQAAPAGTTATGGGVEVGIQGVGGGADRPERLDIETLRKMANSDALPSETRAKLAAIVADMEKNK